MKAKRSSKLWIIPLAGLLAGFLFNTLYAAGLTVTWHSIGSPGEKISQVDGVSNGYLYVRGDQGSQYAYLMDDDFANEAKYEWIPVTRRVIEDQSREPQARWKCFPLLVKAQPLWEREFVYNVEGTAYVKMAEQDDGTVWLWKMTRPWGVSMMLALFPVVGLVMGLVVWGMVWVLRGSLRKGKMVKEGV